MYEEREELYFSFLKDLRDSGVTNMFGAAPYLESEFSLEPGEASGILAKWMKSFEKEPEKEEVTEDAEGAAEKFTESVDRGTRFETCPDDLSPDVLPSIDYTTFAYHEKDAEYYRVERYTDKRVYFSKGFKKKFASKTSIGHYNVVGLKAE